MKHWYIHILILLLVSAVVFGFKVGEQDFWGSHWEARRAEVSREMVVSGNWLIPYLNGDPFVTKPPLYYWATALAFSVTGKFDELGARLPSIISAALGVLVTYLWACSLFSRRTGLFAGLILATNFLYNWMARTAACDMMLTLFTTTSLCCFTLGYQRRKETYILWGQPRKAATLWYLLSAVCMGLGNLAKSPIGIAVPFLAIAGFILITRDWKLIAETKPWWGGVIFLLIVLPWFILVYQKVPDFLDVLHQETLFRYTHPMESPNYRPFYYYIPKLGAFAPWIIFLPGVIVSLFSRKPKTRSTSHIFLIIAFLTTFLLFSSVSSKRDYYLLPLYPVLSILVAELWDAYISMKSEIGQRWTWKTMDGPIFGFAALLCLAGIAAPIGVKLYLPSQYLWKSVGFGMLMLGIGVALFVTFFHGRALKTFGIHVMATLIIYLFVLTVILPEINVYRSRKAFFLEVANIISNHHLATYRYSGFAPQFYLQRIVPQVNTIGELDALYQQSEPTFIVMPGSWYDTLQREHPEFIKHVEVVLDRVWTSAVNPKKQKRLVLVKTL